ncbi:MAG TPA: LuxR C-terminal-related transcriptional regulator [Anaeromyxobacteraceae bacterium]|nr:LuxR C-terminal-related transcriptional regulator [Anaeromyxobacteraceae bacterium]
MQNLDWRALAEAVAHGDPFPTLIVDRQGRIQLANRAAARLLGRSGAAMDRGLLDGAGEPLEEWLQRLFRGAERKGEICLRGAGGALLVCTVEARIFGVEPAAALLRVLEVREHHEAAPISAGADFDYAVMVTPVFGGLLRITSLGVEQRPAPTDRPCHLELHGRTTPCADCPVLLGDAARPTVRRLPRKEEAYQVVTLRSATRGIAEVSVRHVDGVALSGLIDARIGEVARVAGLSEREREVLRYLFMGRQLSDIAAILGISARTVRFHQGNLMSKLGADSRVDLIRLLL